MAFLGTDELADIRTHLTATLPTTCVIEYVTKTRDGAGGVTESWTARGTVACRLAEAGIGSYQGITQDTVREGQAWNLTLDYNQTISREDRVTVNGSYYRVTGVNTDTSEILVKRAELVRWA